MSTRSELSDDSTVKELKNPFYGYATYEREGDQADGDYSAVKTESVVANELVNPTYGMTEIKNEVANPTYGMTENKRKGDAVSNPLYGGVPTTNSVKTELATSSGSGLYVEIPARKDELDMYEKSEQL